MRKILLITILQISLVLACRAQGISINNDGSSPNPSAMLDIKSTSKGLLLPRLTSAQRKAIVAPAAGLIVFDVDKNCLYFFDGYGWKPIANSSEESDIVGSIINGQAGGNNAFGHSVAIDGDYAIIGAPVENMAKGAAYVYQNLNGVWTQVIRLTASDGLADDWFGWSVDIMGDYLIVGAYNDDVNGNMDQGSAYIFVRSGATWVQQAKLTAAVGAVAEWFGNDVAIDGDYAVIGTPRDKRGSLNAEKGSVYVFMRTGTTWAIQTKLAPADSGVGDNFGHAVDIDGINLIVGAADSDAGYTNVGAAYFFTRTNNVWAQTIKLTPSDGLTSDYFGSSVALNGLYAVVGSPFSRKMDLNMAGAGYVYYKSGASWTFQTKLQPESTDPNANLGHSVAIHGDQIILGAPAYDQMGTALVFSRNGSSWNQRTRINDPSPQVDIYFGHAVAIFGFQTILACPSKNQNQGQIVFSHVE